MSRGGDGARKTNKNEPKLVDKSSGQEDLSELGRFSNVECWVVDRGVKDRQHLNR